MEKARSTDTGLVVQIADFQRATPTKWNLQGIKLSHGETEHEVAWVRAISWVIRDDGVSALLHQPKLQASQLSAAWNLIHERYMCRPEQTLVPLQLSANDLTIHSSGGDVTLRDVDVRVSSSNDKVIATIDCLPAWAPKDSPIRITITRDRGSSIPSTQWVMETGRTPLPCSAVSDYFPALKRLGPDAEFLGVMKWESDDSDQWLVDFGGSQFRNIELSRLFEDLPHRLTGNAELLLDRCTIQPGRMVNVTGTFAAYDGWVGRSLVDSLQTHFALRFTPHVTENPTADVAYGCMAFHFRMTDSVLRLQGSCGQVPGYERVLRNVAICRNHVAMAETTVNDFSSAALLRVLTPMDASMVPITKQTRALLDLMVAPDGRHGSTPNSMPRIKIGAAKQWSGNEPIRQR